MNPRHKFTLQVFEKLGAPLLAAIMEASAGEGESASPDDTAKQAELVAGLLARSVKMGLALGSSLNLKSSDAEADAVRLALTGLSSSLVAGFYRQSGRAPGDNDIARMVTAFEAILSFSDNFTPAADNTLRLEALDPSTFLADENQIFIQYSTVFVPVVNAVAAYSFGRQEKKLVQEIAGKLVARAGNLRRGMLGDVPEKEGRRAELQILGALVGLFVEGYEAEMNRLMALGEKERADMARGEDGALSMDTIWSGFETRVAMIELLGQTIASDSTSSTGPAPTPASIDAAPVASPPEAAPVAETPPPVPPQPPQEAPPPAPPEEQAAEGEAQNYNPMSFFRPKSDESET